MTVTRTPLTDRDLGWLRYLHRKATTEDSWDRTPVTVVDGVNTRPLPTGVDVGECPSDHWDNVSNPPGETYARFDLLKSSYSIAMMALRTPAWREVYDRIYDELIHRYTGWWGTVDWVTQLGPDPGRANYPDHFRWIIPESQWGSYDAPGWAGNGLPPWGVQMDPIRADGALFYKGFLLNMLGLHRRATGSDRWDRPFEVVRDGKNSFTWTHSAIAEHLATQWRERPEGIHCENTKVWPFCCTSAGLGLQLADQAFGTSHHDVFLDWWARRDEYFAEPPAGMENFYYDPIIDEHVFIQELRAPMLEVFLAPQLPEDARRRWDRKRMRARIGDDVLTAENLAEKVAQMYDNLPTDGMEPGPTWTWILLAREWGLTDLADAVLAEADRRFGPTWDRARGEFTWSFGLDEEHPRGQANAMMATAGAAVPGAWSELATTTIGDRLAEPTVLGVDFPRLALDQAEWLPGEQRLVLGTAAMNDGVVGEPTTFRVRQLPGPTRFTVTSRSPIAPRSQVLGADLVVHTVVGDHELSVELAPHQT